MPAVTEISVTQLSRLIGTPEAPVVIDVRSPEHHAEDPRAIPCAVRRDARSTADWATSFTGRVVVVACEHGHSLSHGAAAILREAGVAAESLEGGHAAWREAGQPMVRLDRVPSRDAEDRTTWVTRARPKIDRIACPWLIRRFVDARARFLFVPATEVAKVAERFGAVAFDVDGEFFSHRGDTCTFDTMLDEFALGMEPLRRLATIVRGADTARFDLAPECAGLVAASLGFSRMYRDDLAQLDAAMALYDAVYRWCRDATDETHNWPSPKPAAREAERVAPRS
jgi:rhodanese-related sulfurtransferase